ncbi:unnamed protein product [Porites evermanni]|uniref:Uncharacterized protein n=1 Tax=Porites evermanni TaxID=104178 RepID=A0ABN8S6J2_9CNID|nr:unnamed protein product [Porites evermanni]
MAENSANTAKMARFLAITQILTGVLLLCFGIADRLVPGGTIRYGHFGVFFGIWTCITGALGIPGSGRERTNIRNAFAALFIGFSNISAGFGAVIIIVYSILITLNDADNDDFESDNRYHQRKVVISAFMLILGIATFVIGMWAAMCTCLLKPCCQQPQEEQSMCSNNPTDGYLISQLNGGDPVATSIQLGSAGTAPQGSHQPVVLVPVSGASPCQHEIVQVASSEGMATSNPQEQFQSHLVRISPSEAMSSTDSSPQESEIPCSFKHGGYALPKHEENQVDV